MRGIGDGRMLESAKPIPGRGFKFKELYVNLEVMARHLFFVTVGLNSAFLGIFRQTVHAMTYQVKINTAGGYPNSTIALQTLGDTRLAKVVCSV